MQDNVCRPHDFRAHNNDFAGEPNFKCSKCDCIVSAWEMTWYRRGMEHKESIDELKSIDMDEIEEYIDEETLRVDGFDDAIVGIVSKCGSPSVLCYSPDKIIKIMMDRDGMDEEDAYDFFNFNIAGAYMGEGTPVFMDVRIG